MARAYLLFIVLLVDRVNSVRGLPDLVSSQATIDVEADDEPSTNRLLYVDVWRQGYVIAAQFFAARCQSRALGLVCRTDLQ